MNLRFEWDTKKAGANLKKHGVSFEEGLTVFSDPLARIFDDENHSIEENREIIIGHSMKRRLILVCFTERGSSIRLINARKAMPEKRLERNVRIMKKTSDHKASKAITEDICQEYRFDYKKARPNRFANQMEAETIAVVLDADVAAVFKSSESVNTLLRSVISALPENARS